MRTLFLPLVLAAGLGGVAGVAAADTKPNILFIMGDDIGWMQVGAYHQGIGLGETPNIDRLANEGGKFTTYYAMQSCTSGRNVFFTGMYPLRTGMIPPQLPGSPTIGNASTPTARPEDYPTPRSARSPRRSTTRRRSTAASRSA